MEFYEKIIEQAVRELFAGNLPTDFAIDLARTDAKFGDYSTNIAMRLTKILHDNPRNIAEKIAAKLRESGEFTAVEIAGAGFINLTISAKNLAEELDDEFRENAKNSRKFGENNDGWTDENSQLDSESPENSVNFRGVQNDKSLPNFAKNPDNYSENFAENSARKYQKIAVVEYPSPNMAKPYSVGHLRSGNQGWAARNLLRASGWKVITDNHLGDSGTPFGIWLTGAKLFAGDKNFATKYDEISRAEFREFAEKALKNSAENSRKLDEILPQITIYNLGEIYIAMKKILGDEAQTGGDFFAKHVQDELLKLENGDARAQKYSEEFNKISLDHIHKIMARLDISTDYEYGEKFFAPMGKELVRELLNEKIATKNTDGSVIVDLEKEGIATPLLIQKSNGANLYATGDLATLVWREQNWRPDLTVYCVGAEQKFYFEQIAALAKILNLHQEVYHLWFGTIDQIADGKREKMSSRKGVVLMEELLDFALAKAQQNAKSANMSEADLQKISVGAIKFGDFAADRRTGMLFDWDKMFSLTGFSGPYVQYAAVRVNKILRDNAKNDSGAAKPADANSRERFLLRQKGSEQSPGNDGREERSRNSRSTEFAGAADYDFASEKNLILKLLEYPSVIRESAQKLEPHRVANYAYELARELNKYYETTPVATHEVPAEIRVIRLEFLAKIAAVFAHGLGILGIGIPEKM